MLARQRQAKHISFLLQCTKLQRMFGVSPTSDSGTGGWVHADPPSPRAVADAEELPSTLLMIGETGDQPNSDPWGLSMAGPGQVQGAPACGAALLWLAIV